LKKKVAENRKNWPDKLDEVLWAYRTTSREATQYSPYSLVYGMEAITPLEITNPSLRVATYTRENNWEECVSSLDLADEGREKARIRVMEYQRRIKKAFDRRVAPRHFQPRDLVLRKVEATGKKMGKLDPAWEGPLRVVQSHGNGAYVLETTEGFAVPRTWNVAHLRKFFV
jgi:hypothetical protein